MSIRVLLDRATGVHHLVGDSSLVENANRFLRSVELRGLSPRTIRAYAYDIVCLCRWLEHSNKQFSELTERDMLEFISAQHETRAKPRSINRRLTSLRLWFRFVSGQDIAHVPGTMPLPNPRARRRDRVLGIHLVAPRPRRLRVKTPVALIEPLSKQQVRAFLRRLHRYRDIAMVYLMLLCGLRSREVRSVRLTDLDFDEHRLRVRGKGNKERLVPLPSTLVLVIRRYLDLERPTNCSSDTVFVVLQGKTRGLALSEEALRMLFRHRRKDAGLASANAHRFRHTFGTDMARGRVRLPILQRMMGHANPEITLRYINLAAEDLVEEYDRVIAQITSRYGMTKK